MVGYLSTLKKDKKGLGIDSMKPAIVSILIIGLMLGLGLIVLVQLRIGIQQELTGLDVTANSSADTALNSSLASIYVDDSKITVIWSNGTSVTNYTANSIGGIVWGANVAKENATSLLNISYKYKYDINNPEKSLTTSIAGTDDFADWIAIIVVVLAAAIILGIVMKSFGRTPSV